MDISRSTIWLVLILGGIATASLAWYSYDRAAMLGTLCQAGLPNLSRPASIDSDELGCVILGSRVLMKGTLLTGFEASNLIRSDLPPPNLGKQRTTGNTMWSYRGKREASEALDSQLERTLPGICNAGIAEVTAYGWPTESEGRFGHLGMYARVFYADEIVKVGPPPNDIVEHYAKVRARMGLSDCN